MKKVENRILNGEVTQEQINAWKAKHNRVSEVSITEDNTTVIGYFKRPDMETMAAVNAVSKADEIKGANIMFDNCWLGGDPIMKEDAIIRIKATTVLSQIFNNCVGELKNL